MKKTGELLKKARESKNLTIQEVAMATKINHRILKAIEDGDIAKLPAKTFLRGFVVSYASLLKLDSDALLNLMAEELNLPIKQKPVIEVPVQEVTTVAVKSSKPPTAQDSSDNTNKSVDKPIPLQRKSNENAKAIGIAFLIMALVGLIILSTKIVDKYTKEAQIDNSQEGLTTSPIIVSSPEPDASIPADVTDSALMSESTQAVLTPIPTPLSTPVATPIKTIAPSPTPVVTPTLTPSPTPKASATPSPSPSASATPTATQSSKNIELIIEAKADIEVEYSTKSGASGKFKLSKDQIHTFKSKNGLNISISTGGSAAIILNGKDLGTPGEKNKPLNLIY